MGDAKRRKEAEEQAQAAVLDAIRAEDWPTHIAALYEEIAALATALGMPTPRLRAAGLDAAGPGTILASLRQLAAAVQQAQQLLVVQDAKSRAIIDILCRLAPHQAPAFRAMIETACDLARQERDPDKQRPGPLVSH